MSTFTLMQWGTVNRAGNPVGDPLVSTGNAFGAPLQLASGTVYFRVIPQADARFLLSVGGDAATANHEKIIADFGTDGEVAPGSRPYVYLIAA